MIDRIKIGSFLKTLRKEKSLSQEELAEIFGVSSRSISRWENGNTMPELGTLVELADFYGVDIKEIIDGERKTEAVTEETKESLRKAAEYSGVEKKLAVKRQRTLFLILLAALAVGITLGAFLLPTSSGTGFLGNSEFWLGVGITGLVILWGIVIVERLKERKKSDRS